jgi:sirohydrochlorin ferrochelatase
MMPDSRLPTDRNAIIVSHGQPSDPDPAETKLGELAARVGALLPGWLVESATLAKPGALEEMVERVGQAPLVYPLFMTDGWFTRTMLPKRLNREDARILPPMGTDPALPDLARDYLAAELAARSWQAEDCCLIIAAHGSGKSRNSARDTKLFAEALADRVRLGEMRVGYIEEKPFLHVAAAKAGERAICLPFFAAEGGHALEDIPEELDKAGFEGVRLPPIGTHAAVPAMIAAALRAEYARQTRP